VAVKWTVPHSFLSNAAQPRVLRKVKAKLQRVFQSKQPIDRFGAIDAELRQVEGSEFLLKQENFDPEKMFFIIFSYKNGMPQNGLPQNSYLLDKIHNPPMTTLGFKQIFWKVFQRVYSVQLNHAPINWLGINLVLREACVLVTQEGSSASNEPTDCLVVYSLESIDYLKDEVRARVQNVRRTNGLTEQQLIEAFNQSIVGTPYGKLADITFSDFPGYSLFTKAYPGGAENIFPFLYGFYYYGWLLCQRLERDQMDITLDLNQSTSSQSLRRIAEHRIRLVNIQRYFLTLNRSNLQSAKEAADMLRDSFSLPSRYARHTEINNSFEEHLANVSRISETERSQTFKQIAAVLTFLGVPLALFSALMSASSDAAIVVRPEKLWSDYKFLIITLASFLLPSSLIFFGFFVDLTLKSATIFRKAR
jgi:hypothetical protein